MARLVLLLIAAVVAYAKVERVVILKVDGLPPQALAEHHLPNIEATFTRGGVTLDHFYVRGLSLSAPSWSLLDSGRPLEIHGNVEYDRYTLRPYDYLNFVPFYFGAATAGRVDMRAVEVLDDMGVPLLLDRFGIHERHQAFQLFQRGVRWDTLKSALKRVVSKAPGELLDEWLVGMSLGDSLYSQYEHDLLTALRDPKIRYLDFFLGEYDHVAHLTNDRVAQRRTLEELDAFVGRVAKAIAASPLADSTALILVSDHGMNSDPTNYSQGYSLVDWFGSSAGGAHHVLTNRHPLSEFKVRGLDPFVSTVITPSAEATYLKDQDAQYPTVMLDLDGNERASIGLRNNMLNMLQIFLDQLTRKRLPGPTRVATLRAFFELVERIREPWTRDLDALQQQLAEQQPRIQSLKAAVAKQPKKWTPQQIKEELHRAAHRQSRSLALLEEDQRSYGLYVDTLRRLFKLTPVDFDPGKFKFTDLIPARSLGPLNSAWDLQNYVTGPGKQGFVLTHEGTFDWDASFSRVNYVASLRHIRVRNSVQAQVGPMPIDFVATLTPDGIWLYLDEAHQALIQTRGREHRYVPIAHVKANVDGSLRYEVVPIGPGFPLAYAEDPALAVSSAWLTAFHSEEEWLRATHRTRYSNALVGLVEQLVLPTTGTAYQQRQRELRRTDLLALASDHWNFNVRGFNPGGNHGSFLRSSTHSVLLFAGGSATGLAQGVHVAAPYDSLSFVPTVLQLLGLEDASLPGHAIQEVWGAR
jgi:hypothetical protein